MQRFAGGFAYLSAGLIAGAASAYVAIENTGVEALVATGGPWSSRAEGLTGKSAIYVRAHYLLQGRLPPAPGQIDEATADTDADGKALTSGCRYKLMSTGPLPRMVEHCGDELRSGTRHHARRLPASDCGCPRVRRVCRH